MYRKQSYWKILLGIAAMVIVVITMAYSYFLAQKLAEKELREAELYSKAMAKVFENQDLNASFGLELDITQNPNFPVIVEDELGNLSGVNFGSGRDQDQDFLLKKKEELLEKGFEPIIGEGYASKLYWTHSRLYHMIRFYPFLQILLVASFITVGYFSVMRSRRDEQNRVWAGLAKETAHQLGTPLSAIIAWLENLKLTTEGNEEQDLIINELENDVGRLELIADRFSKIGSVPELKRLNVVEVLFSAQQYMAKRSPRKVVFDFPPIDTEPVYCEINEHLFHWVIENLIRNSLDAMDGEGTITGIVYEEPDWVFIDISDTGTGIPANKQRTIFQPGYSTKSRGWGLGLSLAKRIVKDYHKGKIFVKKSRIGEGTTFTIQLPKSGNSVSV